MFHQDEPASPITPQTTLPEKLTEIANRSKTFTGASGAAIALTGGKRFYIRACCGTSPGLGVPMLTEKDFAKICESKAKLVRCDDIETDASIDTAVYRALKMKSMIIVPIADPKSATGVLAVFSSTPKAFTGTHVAVLRTLAEIAGHMLSADVQAKEEPRDLANSGLDFPAVAEMRDTNAVVKAATIPPPPQFEPSKPQQYDGHKPKHDVIVGLASNPVAELKPSTVNSMYSESRTTHSSRKPSRGKKRGTSLKKGRRVFAAAIVLISVVVALALLERGILVKKTTSLAVAAQVTSAVPGQPSRVNESAAQNASIAPAYAVGTSAEADSPDTSPLSARDEHLTMPNAGDEPSNHAVAPSTAPPVVIHRDIAASPKFLLRQEEEAPQLDLRVVANPAPLGDVLKASMPLAPFSKPAQIVPSQLIFKVPPVFPAQATIMGLHGDVVVSARVTKTGSVTDVQTLSGEPILSNAAINAVKQWRYKPSLRDGVPVDSRVEITFRFKAPS